MQTILNNDEIESPIWHIGILSIENQSLEPIVSLQPSFYSYRGEV